MRHTRISRMLLAEALGLIALPGLALPTPQQQSQQDQSKQGQSVAEAARKAKEQQKTAPKAATVWTNETIGTVQGSINVIGQPGAAASTASPAATPPAAEETGAAAPPEASAEDLAKVQSQLDDARKELASLKTDLDLLQRKYDLDAAQYYGTPNYAANQKGQTMLNGEKSAIAAKKPAVDAAQKKVDELEKQFKALGGKPAAAPAKQPAPQS